MFTYVSETFFFSTRILTHEWHLMQIGPEVNLNLSSQAVGQTSRCWSDAPSHGDATFWELFVTQTVHMQMLCLWFLLIRPSTLALGYTMRTQGLFRCNCLSGLIVPGCSCVWKHLCEDQSIRRVCQLCFKWLSSQHTHREVIASPEMSKSRVWRDERTSFWPSKWRS